MNTEKPTLVLLSGLLCDELVWRDIRNTLSPIADVKVFSFAGFSDFDEMAKHVLTNTPSKFALAGHSMGGRVALQLHNLEPDRVTHLALLNTGVHPKKDAEVAGRMNLLGLADSEGMQAVAEQWLPPMMSSSAQKNSDLMDSLQKMILRHTPEDFHGQIHALLNRPDAEPFLSEVKAPTLLLSGNEDKWSPIEQHASMQKHLEHSKLVELEGVGHMSTVEAPEAIAAHFKEWLQND